MTRSTTTTNIFKNHHLLFMFLYITEVKTTHEHISATAAKSLQSCPTLCDPIDGSPPGSIVPGILQARTLEWVAISFSKHISKLPVMCFLWGSSAAPK